MARIRLQALLVLVLCCAGLCLPARAADAEAAPPPARVGELSLVTGTACLFIDPAAGWEVAELNTPVTSGMSLATDKASRLEVRIGSAALRLGAGSQLAFTELDDGSVNIELARGTLALRVRTLAPGERFSVGAGAGGARLTVLAPGAYRASYVAREGRLTVQVLEGQARLTLNQQDTALQAHQFAVADARSAALLEQGASDERKPIDDFAQNRDRLTERSAALRHLPAEMTGAEALDGHGSWRDEAAHGAVWYPNNLPLDWAPYRYGRWRWLAPWGWTWVDDAPWGFAPFHYGRWLFLGGRWGWVPGSAAVPASATRPVYAPALVGFYGSHDAAHWTPVAAAPAVVGWYPLAPGEVYWPAYGGPITYVRALNAASVSDTNQIRAWPEAQAAGPAHRFARTAFAATAMPQTAFEGMQAVASNQVQLPPAALAQAPLSGRRAPPALVAAAPRAPAAAAAPPVPGEQAAPAPAQAARAAGRAGARAPRVPREPRVPRARPPAKRAPAQGAR